MGGGGSSSGGVSYSAYMETKHEEMLDYEFDVTTAGTLTTSCLIYNVQAANPYDDGSGGTITVPSTTTDIAAIDTAVSTLATALTLSTPGDFWDAVYSEITGTIPAVVALETLSTFTFSDFLTAIDSKANIFEDLDDDLFSDAALAASVTAFSDSLETELTLNALPIFKRGMQNVNAVMSSAFSMGESFLIADKAKKVTEFETSLRFKNEEKKLEFEKVKNLYNQTMLEYEKGVLSFDTLAVRYEEIQAGFLTNRNTHLVEQDKQAIQQRSETEKMIAIDRQWFFDYAKLLTEVARNLSHYTIEGRRIAIVAKKEEYAANVRYEELNAKWDIEAMTYAGNLLAAISGGINHRQESSVSTGQSVLGGALSGAAMGAQIGGPNPMSVGIGAAVGGIAGLLG